MNKAYMVLATVGTSLLLLGAGCAETSTNTEATMNIKDADSVPVEQVNDTQSTTNNSMDTQNPDNGNAMTQTNNSSDSPVSEELVLSAQALGPGVVKLSWSAPEGLTEANRFIIVKDVGAYPVHDNKHSWFRQFYTNREMIWSDLSAGTLHFRICLTENKQNDVCAKYSNDVEVEVK